MKRVGLIALILSTAAVANAWEIQKNPDRYPSFGIEASTGKLAGIQKDVPAGAPHTDGGFVQGRLDVRLPISSNVTVNLVGENTGVNNNLQFSEGNRVGLGVRVYIQ